MALTELSSEYEEEVASLIEKLTSEETEQPKNEEEQTDLVKLIFVMAYVHSWKP